MGACVGTGAAVAGAAGAGVSGADAEGAGVAIALQPVRKEKAGQVHTIQRVVSIREGFLASFGIGFSCS